VSREVLESDSTSRGTAPHGPGTKKTCWILDGRTRYMTPECLIIYGNRDTAKPIADGSQCARTPYRSAFFSFSARRLALGSRPIATRESARVPTPFETSVVTSWHFASGTRQWSLHSSTNASPSRRSRAPSLARRLEVSFVTRPVAGPPSHGQFRH
jgi:hypothetical protein